jgi:hypothetical protein
MDRNFAYFKAWAAGVIVEQAIPLPADIEFPGPNRTVCRYIAQKSGDLELQEGELPKQGRHEVHFKGAGKKPVVVRHIEFPA